MKELKIAVDWEVGPYYNDVLDNGGSMPSIDSMVATVRGELSTHRYTEGGKYPLATWRSVPSTEEVRKVVADMYYPHLVPLPTPTMELWAEGERLKVYSSFDKALSDLDFKDPLYFVMLIDGVPVLIHDAIAVIKSMVASGHYESVV